MKFHILIAIITLSLLTSLSLSWSPSHIVPAQDTNSPGPRGAHAMVYDPHNEQVVMFGGATYVGGFRYLSDTWVYSYNTNRWTQLILNPSPSARSNHVMVYSNITNEIILFGGQQGSGTWSFDCESQTWSQIATITDPGEHHSLGMAYDPKMNAVILFGGFNSDGVETDDTWKFNVETREWSDLAPSTTPLARYGHVMVYDESIQQIIMTCGNTAYQGHQDDTWAYNSSSNTWTELATNGNPDRLKWPSLTYDILNKKAILFGGQVGDNPVSGTWIFDGSLNSWQKRYPDSPPDPRVNTGLAFDSSNNITVLFGGADFEFNTYSDTWAYSFESNSWTVMSDVPTTPLPTIPGPPLEWLAIGIAAPAAVIVILLVWRRR
ncbi:MAG: Kelch repeat-containing protein [Candidatus Thorarchaeota archaeon]